MTASTVDVPAALATRIMVSLRHAKVRGRRVMVRKDRDAWRVPATGEP